MSILHGRDLLSSKYITAIVTDSSNRAFFIPIKYTIGDYFIAEIESQVYVFKIEGKEIHTYRDTLVKSFRVIFFNTSHYRPISDKAKLLELALVKNSLPKADMMMFSVFKILGKREKNVFKSHNITDLKDWINKRTDEVSNSDKADVEVNDFVKQARSIVNYLESLDIEEIITPLKKISEFIEDDLISSDAKFFGTVVSGVMEADMENRKVTNAPIKSKTAWLKIIAVVLLIAVIGMVVYIAYENGAFDSLAGLGAIGEIDFNIGGGGTISGSDILARYPTPEAMKCAIERGDLQLASVPAEFKGLVNSAKCEVGVPTDGGVP